MNRVYKIVWSKAKNAYVVTSELAKNHTKSASGKAVKAALTAAVGMGVLMGGYAADAAAKDIVDKGGNPMARAPLQRRAVAESPLIFALSFSWRRKKAAAMQAGMEMVRGSAWKA